jgi:hypothetical protein
MTKNTNTKGFFDVKLQPLLKDAEGRMEGVGLILKNEGIGVRGRGGRYHNLFKVTILIFW